MSASNTDKFIKAARRWSGQIGASGVDDGSVTTIPLISTTNLPTDTAVQLTIDRVDANGTLTPTKEEVVRGVVSGTNIIDCVRGVEGTAQAHSAGAVVEVILTSDQWNRTTDAILEEHNQDGTHKEPIPEKASGEEIDTGTDDAKFATAKAIADSFLNGLRDGWIPYSAVIPTRASADDPTYVLTFADVDLTSMLSIGMKVKFTQNSATVYGIITAITFSTNTTLTLYCGTDYDVLNTSTYPITGFNYSAVKSPLGFPMDPTKWAVIYTNTSHLEQASPTQNVWYNLGSQQITLPIGAWDLSYSALIAQSTSGKWVSITLSTANNSESDASGASSFQSYASAASFYVPVYRKIFLLLTNKTIYYLNIRSTSSSSGSIWCMNDISVMVIRAVCAYL